MNEYFAHELFTDGGLISDPNAKVKNPSPIGGTIAWVRVENGVVVERDVEIIVPSDIDMPAVSNNNTELLALITAIEKLPNDWRGRINSDSQVALGWVFKDWKQDNIPPVICRRLNKLFAERGLFLSRQKSRLLQGHPTKADLERGIGAKRNLPVSEFNVQCDLMCSQAATAYLSLREDASEGEVYA